MQKAPTSLLNAKMCADVIQSAIHKFKMLIATWQPLCIQIRHNISLKVCNAPGLSSIQLTKTQCPTRQCSWHIKLADCCQLEIDMCHKTAMHAIF